MNEQKILFCTALCDGEINGESIKKSITGLYPSVCQRIADVYGKSIDLRVTFMFNEKSIVEVEDLNCKND